MAQEQQQEQPQTFRRPRNAVIVTRNVQIDFDVYQRLAAIAEQERRSINGQLNAILRDYVTRRERRTPQTSVE